MSKTFDARNLMLSHLKTGSFTYYPKEILTDAIFVTKENIGKLSLEFEAELEFDSMFGVHFHANLGRSCGDEEMHSKDEMIGLNDWIFFLNNEVHVWRDDIFRATFDTVQCDWPEKPKKIADAPFKVIKEVSIDMFGPDKNGVPHTGVVSKKIATAGSLVAKYEIGMEVYVFTRDVSGEIKSIEIDERLGQVRYEIISGLVPKPFWEIESNLFTLNSEGSQPSSISSP